MARTLLAQLDFFADFLLAYTHTLLCLRNLYPRTSFVRARFHNTPVYQSRHPTVCRWVRDAIAAVHAELLSGTVARIGMVIYWHGGVEQSGSPKILERYMLDVSSFPMVSKEERNMHIEWDNDSLSGSDVDESSEGDKASRSHTKVSDAIANPVKGHGGETSAESQSEFDVDMSEQFRAALVTLNTRCSRLKPLPKNCSFNLCMELKDEPGIDPPLGHPQPWIPAQGGSQRTATQNNLADTKTGDRPAGDSFEGAAKVTPIRSVEAGVLRFDTWVEEGKAKFELDESRKESPPVPSS
jgi:mitotic spindle assembly checkpoint protein MAD2B